MALCWRICSSRKWMLALQRPYLDCDRVRPCAQSYEHYEKVKRERAQQGLEAPPEPNSGAAAVRLHQWQGQRFVR